MKALNFFACFVGGFKAIDAFAPMHSEKISRLRLKSKSSDRARVEKNLEDLMDNDWRHFRANLVARENIEKQETEAKKAANCSNEPKVEKSHENIIVQEKLGHIFTWFFHKHREEEKKRVGSSIFSGETVGGASSCSMIPMPESCEDPFVSVAEIPVLMKSKVSVDKHRWAHPITHIEPGCVLVANERLGGVFHQTVVLIIDHDEARGSIGIVINRPLGGDLLKITSDETSNIDTSLKMAFRSASVAYGGPVNFDEYSVLHGYGEVEGSRKVAPGVFVGGSKALMTEVRKNNLDPKDALFVRGHASWVFDQLSNEISKGVWYVASCSSDFMLRYAGAPISNEDIQNDLWADVLTCMGGQYADVAMQHAAQGDRLMSVANLNKQ